MTTSRLIEHWLPIAEIGIESLRERTPMTPFPAPNRLHVWWARRPLVASRAAVLGSLLPATADQAKFKHVLGIHGDPIAARLRIDKATREGRRLGANAYGYSRAFTYQPNPDERSWIVEQAGQLGLTNPSVLDPTAGGGAIPLEAVRLGLPTYANDLNPVAALIERATIQWPSEFGIAVRSRLLSLGATLSERVRSQLSCAYPEEPGGVDARPDGYIWARTITCPHCDGLVPLSPNWRLTGNGTGVRVKPDTTTRRCGFEIVTNAKDQSEGTVARGDGLCPFPDCGRPIDGDHIKTEAQAGRMGEQLYAIVYKRRVLKTTKTGRKREGWERGYRAPTTEDDVSELIAQRLADKMPLWEAEDLIPNERISEGLKTEEPRRYGMNVWRDLFSPRQLLGLATAVEIYRELLEEERAAGRLDDLTRAAFGYLALSLDKLRDYNSRMTRWHANREVLVNTFDRHDFAFKWSYAEMAPLIVGLGFDWAIELTAKCIEELVSLLRPGASAGTKPRKSTELDERMGGGLFVAESAPAYAAQTIELSCKSGEALDHITDASIDCVVMDPPYYDNVMYAELSDFFYVWLKRTAGRVYPELFRRQLTDKDSEAVANPARFRGEKGAKALAGRDYQQRMAAIFAECRRVLKPDGIMTLMFTHKATGAWDALTKGLMEAGFTITASWPINTEAEGSLHIKDKAAANSTIFLVCRPRPPKAADDTLYWEDVEPTLAAEVRRRVADFQKAGIRGVDLYLASFGPALQEFSKHWPLRRGRPRPQPKQTRRNRQAALFQEESDPYEATPEDALEAARREVKDWRLKQLVQQSTRAELDAPTAWFVLAWDSFGAPEFPYDEALMLARAVGVDLERDIVGKLAEKKANNLHLLDSAARVAKGRAGAADGSSSMLDVLHHAAQRARSRGAAAALELLQHNGLDSDPKFLLALEALLEVLPVPPGLRGESGEAEDHAGDFDALEKLRRLAFADQIGQPEQLRMFEEQQRALGAAE
jgi:putative DNA methylase